ncbi:FRAS1-related extracellular matrix protein 2-like [Tubulanus polymorphus]|uniref:FRAS1-related extracellular matrix protein 2-like n=1 Tax=Tubulanus polymorphus TaxID=672921 RepID=UPI003DA6A1D2
MTVFLLIGESFTQDYSHLLEQNILRVNRQLSVPFGRTVYLDPNRHLGIHVEPGDSCVVKILHDVTNPWKPGLMFAPPSGEFPCRFAPGAVYYSHFGARSPVKDTIKLQIKYDSPAETLIIPFLMTVKITFEPFDIIEKNQPLEVPRNERFSQIIDNTVLNFNFNKENERCALSVIGSLTDGNIGNLPRYGKLEGELEDLIEKSCTEFITSGHRYRHTKTLRSPQQDFIPMLAEVTDNMGNVRREYFQITVEIKSGHKNTKPKANPRAHLIMEVNQFVMTAITTKILAAEDLETPASNLVFRVSGRLPNGGGMIVSTDDRRREITEFRQSDVKDLKIAYTPPSSDSNNQRIFQAEMVAVDEEGLISDPFTLMIVVKPKNTLAPIVTTNTGLSLYEGQSRTIKLLNLEISDEDNLRLVRVSVIGGLRHGELHILGGKREYFTPSDLASGLVTYQHDGSDTYSDNIVFRMTDGTNEVEFLFAVIIYPVDDTAPVVDINTGITIRRGDYFLISRFILSATDVDSEDSSIRFRLVPPFSRESQVVFRQTQAPFEPKTWRRVNDHYERAVMQWTRRDIDDERVYYKHVGDQRSHPFMDRLRFHVLDNNVPPNESSDKEIVIKVLPYDSSPPQMHPDAKMQMVVQESILTPFGKHHLRYTDETTHDRDIKYTITKLPHDIDESKRSNAGKIVLTDNPSVEVTTFNQAQVNHHLIAYKPPSEELGIATRVVIFNYKVEDPNGNALPDQMFKISLRPIDNKPPTVLHRKFRVMENGFYVLKTDVLDVVDPDTDVNNLIFTITDLPDHGRIQLDGKMLQVGDKFKRDDIQRGAMVYVNTGVEMELDNFCFDVTDGIHHVEGSVNIEIKSIDDEAPTLEVPDGSLSVFLEVGEGQSVTLTTDKIRAIDRDTDDLLLTFIIDVQPREGIVALNGRRVRQFTQKDVVEGRISYRHVGGEIGLKSRKDSFNLTISDMSHDWIVGGNKINKVTIYITILPIDNEAPVIVIGHVFTVEEGGKAAIMSPHLMASDTDTEMTDIVCTITDQPQHGYLENISPAPGSQKPRLGIMISSYTIKEIYGGKINYVQSIHKGLEPVEDKFSFRCSDGVNSSPKYQFPVIILPQNDEPPEIYVREFVVLEGRSLQIDTPILNALDRDVPPDKLFFTILEHPTHGSILRQKPTGAVLAHNFSLADISVASTLVYEHDDSETKSDEFKIRVSDGIHSVDNKVVVAVIPVDDETPVLEVNNGLHVERGKMRLISNDVLRATDLDSDDENLLYVIWKEPTHGKLQRVKNQITENLTTSMNFTQRELDAGQLRYFHKGSGDYRDLIKFDVTDGFNPLVDQYFHIVVDGVDLIYPQVVNSGVELAEGGDVVITTDVLSTSDRNSPDENLIYTISRSPRSGHLESVDKPGERITQFTQLELAGNKIKYVHTSDDEERMDSFEFKVTDGFNTIVQTFRISISDIDNKKPVLMFSPLSVKEGKSKLITPFNLKAVDRDTEDNKVKFHVTQSPMHGRLLKAGLPSTHQFTMDDLNQNLISYEHDGTETIEDKFMFVVTDGSHYDFYVYPNTRSTTRRPQLLQIKIIPVDNGVPYIGANFGVSSLSLDDNGQRYGAIISNRELNVLDRDSPPKSLDFEVTHSPKYGILVDLGKGGLNTTSWSQDDIDGSRIKYVLTRGINATSDEFIFKVTDKGGNSLEKQRFTLNWPWISLEKSEYIILETKRHLELTLKRRGYLKETSFVSIGPIDGSARKSEDFKPRYATQVQFNPGQTSKKWRLRMVDDDQFEKEEQFRVHISEPIMALIEEPTTALITVRDPEDESTVSFREAAYNVSEDIGVLTVPIHRSGDLMNEFMVICATEQDSATGTIPGTVTSYSDYITRPEDQSSAIRFDRYEKQKTCRLTIIDDALFEEQESFRVRLSVPIGGRLGLINTTIITIKPDENDKPQVYFSSAEYVVDESEGHAEVIIVRSGPDVTKSASVLVRTRETNNQTAEANVDYVPIQRRVEFPPGVVRQKIRVKIIDDAARAKLEGEELFSVVLRVPEGAEIGEPGKATIIITDSKSDLPRFQFGKSKYEFDEAAGQVQVPILRSGDRSFTNQIRCYTRQGSAQVARDFVERPNSDLSLITFHPGEREKSCNVQMINDDLYEANEEFRLLLGMTSVANSVIFGSPNTTVITINDERDKAVIGFGKRQYVVKEPSNSNSRKYLRIPLKRMGDLSKTSVVRVFTRDGSAKSGMDYSGFTQDFEFMPNVTEHILTLEILHDERRELTETFSIHVQPDRIMIADIGTNRVMVFIEDQSKPTEVTFPLKPVIVSLMDYEEAAIAKPPIHGYPVVCITPCNINHPEYVKTTKHCAQQGINDTLSTFRWKTSAPSAEDGVSFPMKNLDSDTFFTSTKGIVLDSIYFSPGSRIQCAATAVNELGEPGLESISNIVTIDPVKGICQPKNPGTYGADPYSAKLKYTGPEDSQHPNTIAISVSIPHRDGMLPVFSTQTLSNFELTLSRSSFSKGLHKCSNLVIPSRNGNKFSFITNYVPVENSKDSWQPHEFSKSLRTAKTLKFYKNLNLESCRWEFVNYYTMSELVKDCGGAITTDSQVKDEIQSYVAVTVPFYLSYIFHSPAARGGWANYDLNTRLVMSFVYDTAVLWQDGVSTPASADLQGHLYPTSMRIRKDNRLVVTFRTVARFRGQFVLSHSRTSMMSVVTCADHPDMTFTLELLQSDSTFVQAEQTWRFTSDYAVRDYSGKYLIQLLPCVTNWNQPYSLPLQCTPRSALSFDLKVRFQQVSDPVPAEYTLDTQFQLVKSKDKWVADDVQSLTTSSNSMFMPDDRIHGRVVMDPVKAVNAPFKVTIEKVFICTGEDGYVPKYDPSNGEYGCVEQSPELLYTFKILDKDSPETVKKSFRDIKFNAMLAGDDIEARQILRQLSGVDGFSMDARPLFEVDAGRQWYLHAIYTISVGNNVRKRSITHELGLKSRTRRDSIEREQKTDANSLQTKGRNIARISLNYTAKALEIYSVYNYSSADSNNMMSKLLPIVLGISGFLVILVIIAVGLYCHRRKHSPPPPPPSSTVTVMTDTGEVHSIHRKTNNGTTRSNRAEHL